MRWRLASPPFMASKAPVINIRNTESNYWKFWLKKPEQRCTIRAAARSAPAWAALLLAMVGMLSLAMRAQAQNLQGQIMQAIPGPGIFLTTNVGDANHFAGPLGDNAALSSAGAALDATGVGAGLGAALIGVSSMTMSCPVFVSEGTLLDEDSCVWTNVTGQQTRQFGATIDGAFWRVGGQKEVGPGWFLGGALGLGGSSTQTSVGPTGSGRTLDAGVAMKRVSGPLLLAVGLSVSSSSNQENRFVGLPSGSVGVMQSDTSLVQGGLRVRAAYDVVDPVGLHKWYLRPRLDVDANYANLAGFQEYGPAPVAISINSTERVAFVMTPTLEIGGRYNLSTATFLRPYLSAGASFMPNNNWTLNGSLGGATLAATFTGPEITANLEAGLQLYEVKGWEVKVDYKLSAAESFLVQSLGLRGAWHF
jgi:hypothetical protein